MERNKTTAKSNILLDEIDFAILSYLQNDGRTSFTVIADKLSWSHGSDLKNFEGPTERLYHIEAIPSNFIIDPQGIIVAKNVTGVDLEEFLNKTFSKSQQIVKIK